MKPLPSMLSPGGIVVAAGVAVTQGAFGVAAISIGISSKLVTVYTI